MMHRLVGTTWFSGTSFFLVLAAAFLCVTAIPAEAFAAPAACTPLPGNAQVGIFAGVMCTLETTLDSVTRLLFNGIAADLKSAIVALITVYIILFAVSFLAGITNLNAREFTVALFKLGLVWNFAAFWDNGAGLAYDFFRTFAVSGGDMVWEAVTGTGGGGIAGITKIDTTLSNAVGYAASSTQPADVGGVKAMCVAQLTGLAIMLFIMQPALLAFLFIYIFNFIKLFATAILYYFKSLVLISFLIVLSPIFVSFSLFQKTRELFDTWIKHLATNALQMLIMFAFFAMILMVDFASFFTTLFGLFKIWVPGNLASFAMNSINKVSYNLGFGAINLQVGLCSICDYVVSNNYADIACNPNGKVLPPFAIPFQFDFWIWMIAKVIALQILSYILSDFLKKAPTIAQQLGGVRYGGVLGGTSHRPGFTGYTNFGFAAVESATSAFKQAQRNAYYRPGIISNLPGVAAMRNPFTPLKHIDNIRKSMKVAFTGSESGAGIANARLAPLDSQVKDYSQRAMAAKRAMQKAEHILNHHKQMEKDGKVSRAALVSAQNAYNQSSLNSKRWDRKLQESQEKLINEEKKYAARGGGMLGSLEGSFLTAKGLEDDYKKLVKNPAEAQEANQMAYFLPLGQGGQTYDQQELHRLNLENMQNYAQQKIDALYDKLDKLGDRVSPYERSRIDRELSGANNDIKSNDVERVSQCLDTLSSISRDLE